MKIKPIVYFIPLLFGSILSAESGQDVYNQGIDLLYNRNQPESALSSFQKAYQLEPNIWSRPYMIGYTLKNYLKKPEEAIIYLEKSWDLNSEGNELPFKETIICLEQLGKIDLAISKNTKAQAALKSANKTPSPWFMENLSWLYWTKGDINKALQSAPEGSWVKNQLAPRTVEIDWKIQITKLLSAWKLQDTDKLRITIPLDRPYQRLISVNLDSTNPTLSTKRKTSRGNQFLELEKQKGTDWPEEIRLQLKLEQNLKSMTSRPAKLKAASPEHPNYIWAIENRDGLFSLDNPEFLKKVEEITSNGRSTGEKAELALQYLRKNYKYGERVEGNSVKEWLDQGTGDCGYFTYIAIGMLRALKIPVRGIYGLGPWNDPPPALPHSILEIYDASKDQWFPHDPQSDQLYGVINPSYIAFTAGNPKQDAAVFAEDGVWEIDTVWFFWNGSGKETLSYSINMKNQNQITSRSLQSNENIQKPEYIKVPRSGGPAPFK
ncbi:transglutaminase domain-containing protein [Leptospira sp. 'Mane']|uniref:transglutaminase domain-containing protein n=1 Tax=Leptospira sp. 'Mane' TaxID=3387407 RepID=UPI00398B38D2